MIKKNFLLTIIIFIISIILFLFSSIFNKTGFNKTESLGLFWLLSNIFWTILLVIPFLPALIFGLRNAEQQQKRILYKMPLITFITGLMMTVIYFLIIYIPESQSPGAFSGTGSLIFVIPWVGIIASLFFSLISFVLSLIVYFIYKNQN